MIMIATRTTDNERIYLMVINSLQLSSQDSFPSLPLIAKIIERRAILNNKEM